MKPSSTVSRQVQPFPRVESLQKVEGDHRKITIIGICGEDVDSCLRKSGFDENDGSDGNDGLDGMHVCI